MTYQWEPEQIIEPPLAIQLIREQFPELSCKNRDSSPHFGIIEFLIRRP
jgi:hypothetical protein